MTGTINVEEPSMKHNFKKIEPKWQKKWEEQQAFKAVDGSDKPKFYGLVEFPYPSGAGMHVGHIKAYSSIEVLSRKRRMQGYNVLFPIGFDAFGLPTENYAIKTNTHPREITDQNIAKFTNQLKSVGFSFDWSRVIDTTQEDFYKWTQWIFLKMFENGLVFRDKTLVNYCPSCKVVLSNEDSQGGKCDICHSDVIQKSKDVWYLRITQYADKLLEGLEDVDYPANIKQQQVNWIGKSTGAFVNFSVDGIDETLQIYTTRPDTLFGVTFMVIAPEHPLIDKYADRITNMDAIKAYREECAKKTEFERTQLVKEKTGVCIQGLEGVNPVNGKKIPIYIADYVMMGYGTGAIMAVPAHDQRDYDFAKKFGIDIIQVIKGGDIEKEAYTGDGEMINSDFLNGYTNKKDSIKRMLEELEKKGIGKAGVQYKMKDWAFNRQRYWGEPIPIVHCPKCGNVPVPEEELPLRLPEVESYEPTGTGESPLAAIDEWVNCKCPQCGADAKRETNTMPQWAGSSWYFLRYVDNHNDKELVSREKADEMLPVDMYIGGVEHAVLHLLYSRFYTKFLNDIGVIDFDEPFHKLFNQGMITGKNGIKMSKSKGNVVSPDDLVRDYGCDSLRMYELFVGPPELDAEWDDRGIDGVNRFLKRLWNLVMDSKDSDVKASKEMIKERHKLVYDVTTRLESFSLNTVISAFMEHNNKLIEIAKKEGGIDKETLSTVAVLLSPFAPHVAEELWEQLGHEGSVFKAGWPTYDENEMKDDEIQVPVQINGKTKAVISVPTDISKDDAIAAGKEAIADKLTGNIVKEIYVPKKIINIVMK
jgi:leucyl-tRNA synthetase